MGVVSSSSTPALEAELNAALASRGAEYEVGLVEAQREEMRRLPALLAGMSTLTQIRLNKCHMDDELVDALAAALKSGSAPRLRRIEAGKEGCWGRPGVAAVLKARGITLIQGPGYTR